jgi:MFS family permease
MKESMFTLALLALSVVVLDLALGLYGNSSAIHFFEGEQPHSLSLLVVLALVFSMLGGIILGHLQSRLSAVREDQHVDILPELKAAVTSGGFYRSLIASPVIFIGIYAAAKTKAQPDLVVSLLLSFENGFFCQTVLKHREQQVAQATRGVT